MNPAAHIVGAAVAEAHVQGLPRRLLGGVEALTGILMCGWSTGFFFLVVTRLFDVRHRR